MSDQSIAGSKAGEFPASYKLFCLDLNGRITHRVDFDAESDAAAVAFAREHHGDADCEIWELGRKVAYLPRRNSAKSSGPD